MKPKCCRFLLNANYVSKKKIEGKHINVKSSKQGYRSSEGYQWTGACGTGPQDVCSIAPLLWCWAVPYSAACTDPWPLWVSWAELPRPRQARVLHLHSLTCLKLRRNTGTNWLSNEKRVNQVRCLLYKLLQLFMNSMNNKVDRFFSFLS